MSQALSGQSTAATLPLEGRLSAFSGSNLHMGAAADWIIFEQGLERYFSNAISNAWQAIKDAPSNLCIMILKCWQRFLLKAHMTLL